MKKIILTAICGLFSIVSIGCSGSADNGQNQTVSKNEANQLKNDNAAVNNADSGAANNTGAANGKAESTPLPEFKTADEAIAEGVKLLDLNDNNKAIEAFKQAVKLNPESGEAYFRLGIAYAQVEKSEKEENLMKVDAAPTPKPGRAKQSKNGKFVPPPPTTNSEKAFAESVKAYKKFLIKNPKDDAAYFNLGRAYNKLNNDPEAQKALLQAVKLKPEDTDYQTELGAIYVKLAKYDEAVRALKKALEIDSANLQADELLDKAQSGKKRVDFGADKLAAQNAGKK